MSNKKVEEYNFFTCPTCDEKAGEQQKLIGNDFVKHLKEVHGITTKEGVRSMVMHLDGENWFSWTWSWKIGGMTFMQHTRQKRSAESKKYWR